MLKDWRKLQPSVQGQVRRSRTGEKYNPQSKDKYRAQGYEQITTLSLKACTKLMDRSKLSKRSKFFSFPCSWSAIFRWFTAVSVADLERVREGKREKERG